MIAFGRERHLARLCVLYGVVAAVVRRTGGGAECRKRQKAAALVRVLLCGADTRVLVLAAAVGYAASGILLCGDAKHGALHRETEMTDHPVWQPADSRARGCTTQDNAT